MNKKQWIKYNRSILARSNGITFTYYQIKELTQLLNDVSNFVLIMNEDSPRTFNDFEVFWSTFDELCKTCDQLDKKFVFKLQNYLSKRDDY